MYRFTLFLVLRPKRQQSRFNLYSYNAGILKGYKENLFNFIFLKKYTFCLLTSLEIGAYYTLAAIDNGLGFIIRVNV